MIDFNIMNKALKVAWIRRLQSRSEASWKIIPDAVLENLGGISFVSQCNYDVKLLQLNNLPDFYSDILKYWQNTRSAFQKNTSPRNEIIWNNHNIIIDGKTLFYKSWLEKNILRIEDLLDNDGNFLPFNLFSEKFHLQTPFTLYFGLINSVPTPWKLAIKRTPQHAAENNENSTTISTKSVYSNMLKKIFLPPTAESKIIRYGFTQESIYKVYELPFQVQMHFYKALYTSNNHEFPITNNDLPQIFSENITPLEIEDKLSCEGKVTQAECLKALKDFKNEKSPGTDGLQAEFYKYFWKELHADMIRSFNFAFNNGSLSISQRRGIITLIPKPNKDTTLLDNFRPISLLNTDYKILTKVLTKRLEKVLPKVINADQTGYIKNRYIGENIRLISDIMTYTAEKDIPGIALFLDFKKAFDTIEWDFIN